SPNHCRFRSTWCRTTAGRKRQSDWLDRGSRVAPLSRRRAPWWRRCRPGLRPPRARQESDVVQSLASDSQRHGLVVVSLESSVPSLSAVGRWAAILKAHPPCNQGERTVQAYNRQTVSRQLWWDYLDHSSDARPVDASCVRDRG